jgi:MSHA biogenesis protein MshQ
MRQQIAAFALATFAFSGGAQATTVSTDMTVDNLFNFFISTNDTVPGALVGTGNNWPVTYSFTGLLTPGVTNYLHVQAINQGGPGGFIGDYTLSDGAFKFSNGTQSLLTETADWRMSMSGFGSGYVTPTDEGANGVSPWGVRPGINANAHWIWANSTCDSCTLYFSSTITPTIPEPETYAMIVAGLGFMGFWRRRNLPSHLPS